MLSEISLNSFSVIVAVILNSFRSVKGSGGRPSFFRICRGLDGVFWEDCTGGKNGWESNENRSEGAVGMTIFGLSTVGVWGWICSSNCGNSGVSGSSTGAKLDLAVGLLREKS